MEISYNLRYQKFTFSNRVLIDKEGEIIIYDKGFRLKGKGAQDKGELINFSEIKEFYYKDEKVIFISFAKEKYVLSETSAMFEQMLKDLYKSRNEFLVDALFMRSGKLKVEFEGKFERQSKFSKVINKGDAKMRLYENSLIIVPKILDAFSVNFNFISFYEFDELDYMLKIVMDDGQTIFISNLGEYFEPFQEKMNEILQGMYGHLVNDNLRQVFPYFNIATLLKLANKMKGGKSVSKKEISKIDKELYQSIYEYIFDNDVIKEKFSYFLDIASDENIRMGLAKDDTVADTLIRWFMITIPEKNLVLFTVLNRWKQDSNKADNHETYFYRIIMEKGRPEDKVNDKINEIDQALVNLNFVKDPCYKDKRELKHSPYQYAIRKMPFLRILRKSFMGTVSAVEVKDWHKQADEMIEKCALK